MEFSIVAESGIVEEAYKAANHSSLASRVEISVNHQFAAGIFQIHDFTS